LETLEGSLVAMTYNQVDIKRVPSISLQLTCGIMLNLVLRSSKAGVRRDPDQELGCRRKLFGHAHAQRRVQQDQLPHDSCKLFSSFAFRALLFGHFNPPFSAMLVLSLPEPN